MELKECLKLRRDTRHFTNDPVPDNFLEEALNAAHMAPSVGLSEPWRFVVIKNDETKRIIKSNFERARANAETTKNMDKQSLDIHKSLKLEAITSSPMGIAVFSAVDTDGYILGTSTNRDTLNWSVACAIQNMWLSLTENGYSLGWVSILDYQSLKATLKVPSNWHPLGYLCIGKPADDYDSQPMLQQKGWKKQSDAPTVLFR